MPLKPPYGYFRRAHVRIDSFAGYLLIQEPGKATSLRLTGSAVRIWEHLEYPSSFEELCEKLHAEFEVPKKELGENLSQFLDELIRRKLVLNVNPASTLTEANRFAYLGTLKRSLVNYFYLEHELRMDYLVKHKVDPESRDVIRYLRDIREREPGRYHDLLASRIDGKRPPDMNYYFPHTLVGLHRLENLERCAEDIFRHGIPGDFMEAGVAQGGAAVFLRGLQMAYGQEQRRTWVADSFQGLPEAKSEEDTQFQPNYPSGDHPVLSYAMQTVVDLFRRYDLLDDQVCFVPGWFADTLPRLSVQGLALLRIDVDMYQSTMEVLTNLYDKVVPGGYIIIDDYGSFPPCRKAVDEFRAMHGIDAMLQRIDWEGVYWQKDGK